MARRKGGEKEGDKRYSGEGGVGGGGRRRRRRRKVRWGVQNKRKKDKGGGRGR
jgi:hypothetical protein